MRLHPDEYADLRNMQIQPRNRSASLLVLLIGAISGALCVAIIVYGQRVLAADTAPIGCEQHRAELVACVEGL